MHDMHSIIEAFTDGESVDPARLKDALAMSEGRDYLVDLLVLRGFVAGDSAAARPTLLAPPVDPPAPWWRWSAAAAAIVVVSVLSGYYAGQHSVRAPAVGEIGSVTASLSAPEPTRVIKLEDSADWTERVGEN